MSATWKSVGLAVTLGWAAMVLGGCLFAAGTAAGVGTWAYLEGKYTENVKAEPGEVVAATERAFAELKLTPLTKEGSGLGGRVTGREADDTKVNVDVESLGSGISKVTIRIGVFGDEAKSRALMEAIKKQL